MVSLARVNWTEEELLLVLAKYCEIPFGRIHSRNPEIIALAQNIGRTPSAIAMKMVNFASLDPTIEARGMPNVSKLDREIWEKFFTNIDHYLSHPSSRDKGFEEPPQESFLYDRDFGAEDAFGVAAARQGQQKFRKIVLASYEGRCAVSGLADTRLLVASHIAPWASVKDRRLDPRNGICLSALWDKAFDNGLVSLSDNFDLLFSESVSRETRQKIESMGSKFNPPSKFKPDTVLLAAHRERFGIAG